MAFIAPQTPLRDLELPPGDGCVVPPGWRSPGLVWQGCTSASVGVKGGGWHPGPYNAVLAMLGAVVSQHGTSGQPCWLVGPSRELSSSGTGLLCSRVGPQDVPGAVVPVLLSQRVSSTEAVQGTPRKPKGPWNSPSLPGLLQPERCHGAAVRREHAQAPSELCSA